MKANGIKEQIGQTGIKIDMRVKSGPHVDGRKTEVVDGVRRFIKSKKPTIGNFQPHTRIPDWVYVDLAVFPPARLLRELVTRTALSRHVIKEMLDNKTGTVRAVERLMRVLPLTGFRSDVDGEQEMAPKTTEQIKTTEVSKIFMDGMINRQVVSYYKYGRIRDGFPDKVDALKSLDDRIKKYLETHNTEYLIDVANFAMIEFMLPRFDDAKFMATDASGSTGRRKTRDGIKTSEMNKDILSVKETL